MIFRMNLLLCHDVSPVIYLQKLTASSTALIFSGGASSHSSGWVFVYEESFLAIFQDGRLFPVNIWLRYPYDIFTLSAIIVWFPLFMAALLAFRKYKVKQYFLYANNNLLIVLKEGLRLYYGR
jgi:hypothetical protein